MHLFGPTVEVTPTRRQRMEFFYSRARMILLIAVILTAAFTVLAFFGILIPFRLTLAVPLYLVLYGAFTQSTSVLTFTFAAADLLLLLYLLCWYRAKDGRVGFLIAALVLTALDAVLYTAAAVWILAFDPTHYILHALVIFLLSLGIHAHFQLKKLPPDTSLTGAVQFDEL